MKQENYAKYFEGYPMDKKSAAQLTSSNSLVGGIFSLKPNSKKDQISIYNKFSYKVATLNSQDSKKVQLWINKGLEVVALLSYVAYNEPESKHFAEFLILAYPKTEVDTYQNFIENISNKIANGTRPDIKLDEFERKEIQKHNGDFKINKTLEKPELQKTTVILKNKQSLMEKIIEAGRQKKIGCYIGSILFLVVIVALVAILLCQIIS